MPGGMVGGAGEDMFVEVDVRMEEVPGDRAGEDRNSVCSTENSAWADGPHWGSRTLKAQAPGRAGEQRSDLSH